MCAPCSLKLDYWQRGRRRRSKALYLSVAESSHLHYLERRAKCFFELILIILEYTPHVNLVPCQEFEQLNSKPLQIENENQSK